MKTLIINPNGPWHLYTLTIPLGAYPLGVVSRGNGDTGALVRYAGTGEYAQVNTGAIRRLSKEAVFAALGADRE